MELSSEKREELFGLLKSRFDNNINRHEGLDWATIQTKLESNTEKLQSLYVMEETGGEPDVVGYDYDSDEYIFFDCSAETPKGRRSLCYDRDSLDSRKENKPANSAMDMAAAMGIQVLNQQEYKYLQTLGKFDSKTSSWLTTPTDIRKLGGAIYGDFRYGHVFIYHNGAESYYAARGFRGSLRV